GLAGLLGAPAGPRRPPPAPRDPARLGRAVPGRPPRGRGLAAASGPCLPGLPRPGLRGRRFRTHGGGGAPTSSLSPPQGTGVTPTPVALVLPLALRVPGPAFPQAATASLEVAIEGREGLLVHLDGPGPPREETTSPRGRAVFFHLRPGLYRASA